MVDRATLIARKGELRGAIERVQRQLDAVRQSVPPATPRQVRRLEQELERLMGEEYRVRIAIDQAGVG
jgi:hypothetical protein